MIERKINGDLGYPILSTVPSIKWNATKSQPSAKKAYKRHVRWFVRRVTAGRVRFASRNQFQPQFPAVRELLAKPFTKMCSTSLSAHSWLGFALVVYHSKPSLLPRDNSFHESFPRIVNHQHFSPVPLSASVDLCQPALLKACSSDCWEHPARSSTTAPAFSRPKESKALGIASQTPELTSVYMTQAPGQITLPKKYASKQLYFCTYVVYDLIHDDQCVLTYPWTTIAQRPNGPNRIYSGCAGEPEIQCEHITSSVEASLPKSLQVYELFSPKKNPPT